MLFYKIEGMLIDNGAENEDSRRAQREAARRIYMKSEDYNHKRGRDAYCFVSESSDGLLTAGKILYGGITEQEMNDTMEIEFGWRCPYTGRDLKASVLAKDGTYVADHIYPQNRDGCGLNVKGNLILVDKRANSEKGKLDVKAFLEKDSDYWAELGIDKPTRMARMKKIQDFQKKCGYDPDRIRAVVSSMMQAHYDAIRAEQENVINRALSELNQAGIVPCVAVPVATTATSGVATKNSKTKNTPELVFHPTNEDQFKAELMQQKKAHFVLTYSSGKTVITPWNASSFDTGSNLRGNIQSRPFWRNKSKEGLIRVEVFIDKP